MSGRTEVKKVNMAPTWASMLDTYLGMIEDGSNTSVDIAKEGLQRMASLADKYVLIIKKVNEMDNRTPQELHGDIADLHIEYAKSGNSTPHWDKGCTAGMNSVLTEIKNIITSN